MTTTSRRDRFYCTVEMIILILSMDAHFGGQIARSDENHVDAVDGGDGVGCFDSFRRLDHHGHDRAPFEQLHQLGRRSRCVSADRVGTRNGPVADRWKSCGLHDSFGLLLRIYMRHNNSHRSAVQDAGDDAGIVRRHPHQAGDPRAERARAQHLRGIQGRRCVFEIDVHRVVSTGRSDCRNVGRARMEQREAQHQRLCPQGVPQRRRHRLTVADRE